MKEINGDLIKLAKKGEFDAIIHGCNCQGNMGAGLAKQIKQEFPKANLIDTGEERPAEIYSVQYPNGLSVINAYTQIYYGKANNKHSAFSPINNYQEKVKDTQNNRYRFIRYVFSLVNKYFKGQKIGIPKIGCGLAGGDWKVVKEIIEEELTDCKAIIVYYQSN